MTTQNLAAQWLARAHRRPQEPLQEWSLQGVALLPAGPRWDAVKIPSAMMRHVVGVEAVDQIRKALPGLGLQGPVFLDPYRHMHYLLVPSGTAAAWAVPGTDCIGDPRYLHYMGVPHPTLICPPGLHWLAPPDGSGQLVDPAALEAVLTAATEVEPQGSRA